MATDDNPGMPGYVRGLIGTPPGTIIASAEIANAALLPDIYGPLDGFPLTVVGPAGGSVLATISSTVILEADTGDGKSIARLGWWDLDADAPIGASRLVAGLQAAVPYSFELITVIELVLTLTPDVTYNLTIAGVGGGGTSFTAIIGDDGSDVASGYGPIIVKAVTL